MRTPRNLSTTAIATVAGLVGGMVASFGPGLAQAAYDAVNSDKVDGLHAVGAGASVTNRKGKLVATNGSTGRLPNNIIAKAPDSARLGGKTAAQTRAISIPIQAAAVSGSASKGSDAVSLPPTGTSGFTVGMTLPPDFTAGSPLKMDLIVEDNDAGACAFYVFGDGAAGPDSAPTAPDAGDFHNYGWQPPGHTGYEGPITLPADGQRGHRITLTNPFDLLPGQAVNFRLTRVGDNEADNCSHIAVRGLLLRY